MSEYIKREDVLKCLKEASEQIDWGQSGDGDAFKHYIGAVYRTIASSDCVPSADVVERKRGEWICHEGRWIDFDYYPTKYECNQCHHYVDVASDKNFCPNCGADMRGADDE